MKSIFFLLPLLFCQTYCNGQILMTTKGSVSFFSETPLENISAVNSSVASLINVTTDSVLVKMKNTGFKFKNALMQEHFNENYMESPKYPFDSFRGKINEKIDYSVDGIYKVTSTGKLTIHGTTKVITIPGTVTIKNKTIHLSSETIIHTADFKIEIPKLVFSKIAEDIKITMTADYKQER